MRQQTLTASCPRKAAADDRKTGWMPGILGQAWRSLGVPFAFASFMAIALLYALFVFPFVRVMPGSGDLKGRRVRKIISCSFSAFLRACTMMRLFRPLRIWGLEGVDFSQPVIIVANHPTLFDIVVLGSLVPNFNCLVKHKLTQNIFLRGGVKAAEYVTNDRPEEIIQRCVQGFQRSQPLIIFPEGTRSPKDSLGTFSRGAAHLALRTGVPVITAMLECNPPAFRKYQKWYFAPKEPVEYSVRFATFDCANVVLSESCLSARARAMTRELEAVFRNGTGVRTESSTTLFRPAVLIPNEDC